MNRRVTLRVGAAAGGLLVTAFLPQRPWPSPTTAIRWFQTVRKRSARSVGIRRFSGDFGTEVFDLNQGNPFTTWDVFNAEVYTLTTSFGFSNQEIIATGGQVGGVNVPTGSMFDFASFGGGFGNEYSDVIGAGAAGGNAITDTFITPFGDFNIPTMFDAADLLTMPGVIVPS